MYYNIKNMDTPTPDMYEVPSGAKVLLVGTAKPQNWATSIDIDPNSPADIVGDGMALPFRDGEFDYVILDYVTNFLPKAAMIPALIAEANRVGKCVKGRCTVVPGPRKTLRGPKQRFTHPAPPDGVEWIDTPSA